MTTDKLIKRAIEILESEKPLSIGEIKLANKAAQRLVSYETKPVLEFKKLNELINFLNDEGQEMGIFRKKYKPLDDEQKSAIDTIKDNAEILYVSLCVVPVSHDERYMALARTALEESIMWATKSITY